MNKIILVSVSLLIFLIGIGCASAADLTADSNDAPILDDGVSQFGGVKDFNISCARPDVSENTIAKGTFGSYIDLGPGSSIGGGSGSYSGGGFANHVALESHKNSNDKKLGSSATYSVDLKKEQNRPLISFSDRPSFQFEQYINSTSDVDNLSII